MKEKGPQAGDDGQKVLTARQKRGNSKRQVICHYCKKPGHIKRECRKFTAANQRQSNKESSKPKHSARNAATNERESSSTSDDKATMVVNHALAATRFTQSWIVDSGATCHMCNDKNFLESYAS